MLKKRHSEYFCLLKQNVHLAFSFFSICRLSTLRRILLSASLGSEQCQRVKRRNERCGENINICDRITAPAERAERRARYHCVLATLLTSHKDPSVHPANHFTQQGGEKKKESKKCGSQSFRIKPQPNMSLVQVGPDLLFDNGIQR